ncbi:MAG: DUF4405 domain-containing protein [Nanoarchaeota archaeon]|nr:DUF4405 domain-containing protein [Nanoarchaeota archaeon]
MAKAKVNYFVDLLLTLSGLLTITSGLVMFIASKLGNSGRFVALFLGLTKQVWFKIHQLSGIAMAILVILHFILHWKWIVAMTKKIF